MRRDCRVTTPWGQGQRTRRQPGQKPWRDPLLGPARRAGQTQCPAPALSISSQPPVVASSPRVTGPGAPQQGPPGRLSHLDGGGAHGTFRAPSCRPALAPAPPPCLHAVPAVHGGGVLRPRGAARSPLQQDPLLPGPVSTARGPPVVVQGLQGVTGSEEGTATSQIPG